MFNPEIKSADLLKATLMNMSQGARNTLSKSFLQEATKVASYAVLCRNIAIGSAAIGIVAICLTDTKKSDQKDKQDDASWASTFGILGILATIFFSYQCISHYYEMDRLKDLSEFIIEWVPEAK